MKKTGFKRIIALVLSLAMAIGMLPTIANAQSSVNHTVQNDGITYDLPRLPTASNDYVLLKNTASKDVVLLVGVQDGYIGSDMQSIFNYNFEYQRTNFNSYVSAFDGTTYSHWTATPGTPSFSLSGYEVLYKSKDMCLVSGIHLFTTLPEGVTWDDDIIITYWRGAYRLYKPTNNIGVWVDADNINRNFVYRNTLTSENQTVSRYTYNINARTWSGGTCGSTEGTSVETFYFTSDVFSTDGTVIREGQRDFYAQSSKVTGFQFEPLELAEAKRFLQFIANNAKSEEIDIEKELDEYCKFLTGKIEDPQEELNVKVRFLSFFYLCMDAQLAKMDERIEIGTSYLLKWVKEETEPAKTIFDAIKDELWNDLKGTIAKGVNIPKMSIGYDLATSFIDYSEAFVHSLGSFLSVVRKHEINYLRAYLKLLEAEYNGDQYKSLYWKFTCESILNDRLFEGNPQEMRKYAEYIFSIEHSIPINSLAN